MIKNKSYLAWAIALGFPLFMARALSAQALDESSFFERPTSWRQALPQIAGAKDMGGAALPIPSSDLVAHQVRSWVWIFPQDLDAAEQACNEYADTLAPLNQGAHNLSLRFYPGACTIGQNDLGQNIVSLDIAAHSNNGPHTDAFWTFDAAKDCVKGHEALLFLNNDTLHVWSGCYPQADGTYELDAIVDIEKLPAISSTNLP